MKKLHHFGDTLPSASIVGVLLAASLVGCGGGGGGGDDGGGSLGILRIFPADPADDGYFRSDGAHAPTSVNRIAVGANGTAYVAGYARFSHGPELPALVAAGSVGSVLLSLTYVSQAGPAAAEHPQIYVHHTDFGAVIDGDDFDTPGTFIPDGVIQWPNGSPHTFVLDVTDQVIADIVQGYTDIYLLPTGADTDDSYWYIDDVDGGGGPSAPHLIVEYEQ